MWIALLFIGALFAPSYLILSSTWKYPEHPLIDPQHPIAFVFVCALSILISIVAIGLKNRRLWAWKANWMVLGIQWLNAAFPKHPTHDWQEFAAMCLGGLIGGGLFWVWPNYIYFRKRRILFGPKAGSSA